MANSEIILPSTEPETEWVRGRPLQKVSPKRDHSRVQAELTASLVPWARRRGEIGTEWRFRVEPKGERRRPLVPDISYVSFERLRGLTREEMQAPALSPNVAIEIVSPDDDSRDVASKVEVYLQAGTELVIVVDPIPMTIAMHDGTTKLLARGNILSHPALPGFSLDVGELFDNALRLEM